MKVKQFCWDEISHPLIFILLKSPTEIGSRKGHMYVGLITAGNQKLSLILVVELLHYLVLYAWTDVPRYGPVEK